MQLVQEKFRIHRETWGTFDDNKASKLDVGARQGDLRAAMAPFLANITFREARQACKCMLDASAVGTMALSAAAPTVPSAQACTGLWISCILVMHACGEEA